MLLVKAGASETRTPQNKRASTRTRGEGGGGTHLLWSLQPLLELEPQLVGRQPELGALCSQYPLP